MVLLRKVIGDALRARRLAQHRTLREVSTAANVSLGYLSEIERGHKEASSELLASICDALGAPISEMLGDVTATFALAEQMDEALFSADAEAFANGSRVDDDAPARARADARRPAAARGAHAGEPLLTDAVTASARAAEVAVTDGDVTVEVHSDGPLRTRLTAKRATPGQRHVDPVLVG